MVNIILDLASAYGIIINVLFLYDKLSIALDLLSPHMIIKSNSKDSINRIIKFQIMTIKYYQTIDS